MRNMEIDLMSAKIDGRGRNGWLKVTKVEVVEQSRTEADGSPRTTIALSGVDQGVDAAPIILDGTTDDLLKLFATLAGFLMGID